MAVVGFVVEQAAVFACFSREAQVAAQVQFRQLSLAQVRATRLASLPVSVRALVQVSVLRPLQVPVAPVPRYVLRQTTRAGLRVELA